MTSTIAISIVLGVFGLPALVYALKQVRGTFQVSGAMLNPLVPVAFLCAAYLMPELRTYAFIAAIVLTPICTQDANRLISAVCDFFGVDKYRAKDTKRGWELAWVVVLAAATGLFIASYTGAI